MKNNAQILIRVTAMEKMLLQSFAKVERRSLSAYVRRRLKESVCFGPKFGLPTCGTLKLKIQKMCPACSGIIEDQLRREGKKRGR